MDDLLRTGLLKLVNQWRKDAIQDFRVASDTRPSDSAARRAGLAKSAYADQVEALLDADITFDTPPGDVLITRDAWGLLCEVAGVPEQSMVDEVVTQLALLVRTPHLPTFLEQHRDAASGHLVGSDHFRDLENTFGGSWHDHAEKVVQLVIDHYNQAYLAQVQQRRLDPDAVRRVASRITKGTKA